MQSLCVMITLAHVSFDDSGMWSDHTTGNNAENSRTISIFECCKSYHKKVLPFNPLRAAKVMFSKWIQTILVIISILFTAASTVNTPLINSKKVSWKLKDLINS